MTKLVDFSNSYMTFFTHDEGNVARCRLDAACTLHDDKTGTAETFYLIVPCRAEDMYADGPLFKMPNYEFSGIWKHDEMLILRTRWESEQEKPDFGVNRERFADVRLHVRYHADSTLLAGEEDIITATLENGQLVAQTESRDAARGLHAVLEYPMKTINVLRRPPRFQVDTGPVIVPDFASVAARAIERFDVAYVVYNTFDHAEFILRRPVAIGRGPANSMTTDYSMVIHVPARNQIFRVG